ncbi:MAG: phosphoribosylformylglycinamidine cyclo-ligase [Rhodothermales bacterium]
MGFRVFSAELHSAALEEVLRGLSSPYISTVEIQYTCCYMSTTYKDAGVDIAAGEEMVRRIKPLVRETFTKGVLADIGAFGGFFQLDVSAWKQPVLVSSVDGVGTKLKVAFKSDKHDTVGQDLVNHCVNDIAVCGATPLYFLDYFSTGSLDTEVAVDVISGFSVACKENGCALIGGETAEMPDLYQPGEYDLAGTIVGVVEKDNILDGSRVREGDVLVGLPSTGLHTNGYSLARKVLFEHFEITDRPDALGGRSVGEALLAVHRSYLSAVQALTAESLASAFVHVTGGGIPGNTQRVMPEGLTFEVDYSTWERPALFKLIGDLGSVPEEDMRGAFNLGIGLIAIIPERNLSAALDIWIAAGETPVQLGRVVTETLG